MLIPLRDGEPIYRQIYGFVRTQILSGRLPSGTRLPSTRSWAAQLGVSRTAVLHAYDQLLAEGYVRGRTGSGTVVAADLPESLGRQSFVGDGSPALQALPVLSKYAKRLMEETHGQPPAPPIVKEPGRFDFHYGNRLAADFPHRAWQRLTARRATRTVGRTRIQWRQER